MCFSAHCARIVVVATIIFPQIICTLGGNVVNLRRKNKINKP